MAAVVPINIEHEIVDYIFEESERLPNDFYVHIMDLMKKYYDQQHAQVYNEIQVYINKNKNRISVDVFNKMKEHFSSRNQTRLEQFPNRYQTGLNCCEFIYSLRIIFLFGFIMVTMTGVIVLVIINKD